MRPSIGFQSTHPCGVRPSTYFISLNGFSFNPRTRVGCDNPKAKFDLLFGYVSIHAPVWGATMSVPKSGTWNLVSIHAPVWGATSMSCLVMVVPKFQSTHPCGVRPLNGGFLWATYVSIHAPVWGATTVL